jgi:hypothetical protein
MIELGLLTDPEDAEGHHAHQKNEQAGRKRKQQMPEIVFRVHGFAGRDPKVEHEQRHCYGEDSVAQRGQAVDILSGNTVVERRHRNEFSGSRRMWAKTDALVAGAIQIWTGWTFRRQVTRADCTAPSLLCVC